MPVTESLQQSNDDNEDESEDYFQMRSAEMSDVVE
jgi:hypothetical protein